MLPRFCKLCYQTFDESIIHLRRFSAKHSNVTNEQYSDSESDFEKQDNNEEVEQNEKKPKEKHWIIKCKQSEFNFHKDQVYPKFEAMPLASRGWHHRKSRGDYFTIYPYETDEKETIDNTVSFKDMDLNSELIKNLESRNIINLTEIQKLAIPKILSSKNVALTAETGCGKTFAFLVPLIQQILQWKAMKERGFNTPLGLIITPSKELTLQIAKVAKQLTKNLDINVVKLIGTRTKHMISNPPVGEVDLIVATIGVMNKLIANDIYKLDQVRHVVLDEADTLLDETFQDSISNFLRKIPISESREFSNKFPQTAQLTLNSATIPENLTESLENIIDSSSVETVTTGYEHQISIPQKFFRVGSTEKPMILLKLIKPKAKSRTPVIVFSNTTAACDFTTIFLNQFGIKCTNVHKKMPRSLRKGKIVDFQNGKYHVLATTDAGARGIDTIMAKDVINFEFPLITAEYIHRCGRVGRIGSPRDCRVINLISRPLEIVMAAKIEYAARKLKPIPMVDLIHNKYDEDAQFLTGQELEKNVHKTELDDDKDDFEEMKHKKKRDFSVPN